MLQVIRKYLLQVVDDIDAGNSNLNYNDEVKIAEMLREIVRKDDWISKYQAYTYLGISRSKFDGLVREGKLPKGQKVSGFKELRWRKKDLKK